MLTAVHKMFGSASFTSKSSSAEAKSRRSVHHRICVAIVHEKGLN